jgi:hypothetical protein
VTGYRCDKTINNQIGVSPYLFLLAWLGSDRFDRTGPVLIGRQPQELQELNSYYYYYYYYSDWCSEYCSWSRTRGLQFLSTSVHIQVGC